MASCLDPDYRQDAPKDVPYCVRCQRETSPTWAHRVSVDWETMQVWLDADGPYLLGRTCAKAIGLTQ